MNQYREGKVKSTPMRGVKQTLKPNAYKQWEPDLQIAYSDLKIGIFVKPQTPAVTSVTLGSPRISSGARSRLPQPLKEGASVSEPGCPRTGRRLTERSEARPTGRRARLRVSQAHGCARPAFEGQTKKTDPQIAEAIW